MVVIPIDLHFEKDQQQAQKVPIRREGKIKARGTVASRCDRLSCLHIGLSTPPTMPMADGLTRQVRRSPASRAAFPQCPHDLPPGSPRPPGARRLTSERGVA